MKTANPAIVTNYVTTGTPVISPAQTLVVFDSRVQDLDLLYCALVGDAIGYTLAPSDDAIATITRLLSDSGARNLAIVAHGEPGVIHLGREAIDLRVLEDRSGLLQEWCVDSIALYSCEVGADTEFVARLGELAGARVAASVRQVGSERLGGSWEGDYLFECFATEKLENYSGILTPTAVTISAISDDTGALNTDFVTNDASVTIFGGFVGSLNSGEVIQVSADGTTWFNVTVFPSNTWVINNVPLIPGSGMTLQTRVRNGATTTFPGSSQNYTLDTTAPTTVSIVVNDTALKIGETSLVTFTFSEAVTGFTNADLTIIANGTLSDVTSSDGGVTWIATFTPTASIEDTSNVITLNNIGIADIAGNAGTGTASSNNYEIDTIAPTAPGVPDLQAGSDSNITTDNITNDNTPTFNINLASTGAAAGDTVTLLGASNTVLGTAILTSTDISTGTVAVTSSTLVDAAYAISAKITDVAGNDSLISASSQSVTIDTTAPTAPSLTVTIDGTSTATTIADAITPVISGQESGSTIEYRTNNGAWGSSLAPVVAIRFG